MASIGLRYNQNFIDALFSGGAPIGPTPMNTSSFYTAPGTGLNLNDFVGILNNQNINKTLTPEEELKLFLEREGGEIEKEDFDRFAPQGIFSTAMDFAQRPDVRTGLGFLLGGIPGAALSFFAPKIGEGITSLINRFRPAPSIPRVNINDLTTGGGDFTGATTGTGQDVSAGDLTSIGDTGFSEYSSPETASQYEGSF